MEMAVDVDLEPCRRAVPGPAGGSRIDALEAELPQIQFVDEDIDDAHRAVFLGPVIESFREWNALRPILAFDVPSHRSLPSLRQQL